MLKTSKTELLEKFTKLSTVSTQDMQISIQEIEEFTKDDKKIYISTANYTGYNPAVEATKIVINNFYENDCNFNDISATIIHYQANSKIPLGNILDGMRLIRNIISNNADIYMGITFSSEVHDTYVQITVVI